MRRIFKEAGLQEQIETQGFVRVHCLHPREIDALLRVYERVRPAAISGTHLTLASSDIAYRKTVQDAVVGTFTRVVDELFDDYRLCVGNFTVKRATDTSNEVALHQDWSFVDRTQFREISIWCPLVDVDARNGVLALVPGSHRFRDEVRTNIALGDYYSPFTAIAPVLVENYLQEIPVNAGDAIIHDSRLLHTSRSCQPERDRVVAVAVAIPMEAPLLHYFNVSPSEHEVFAVGEDFYWKDVQLHASPATAKSQGRVAYSRTPFTAEELAHHLKHAS